MSCESDCAWLKSGLESTSVTATSLVDFAVRPPKGIGLSKLTNAVKPSGARSCSKNTVQWLAVRNTVGEMSVPEQIGKIRPSGALTMNAPVLLNGPVGATKPYVMA